MKQVRFAEGTKDPPSTWTCRPCGYRHIRRTKQRGMKLCGNCSNNVCDQCVVGRREPFICMDCVMSEKVNEITTRKIEEVKESTDGSPAIRDLLFS